MEQTLTNTVRAVGNYDSIPTAITSTASVVTMISGLTITKTADKQVWAEGNLTYTIKIDNQSGKTYTEPKITDELDTTKVTFVENSVTIDGSTADTSKYNFDSDTNTLTITLDDIAVTESCTVTFQVSKNS